MISQNISKEYTKTYLVVAVIAAAAFYEVIEAVFLRTTLIEKISFAIFTLLFIGMGLKSALIKIVGSMDIRIIGVMMLYMLNILINPFVHGMVDEYYYIRDLLALMVFISAYGCMNNGLLFKLKSWKSISIALFFTAVLAFALNYELGRYQPPELLIIPLFVYMYVSTNKVIDKTLFILASLFVIYLCYKSGQRTSVLIAIFSFFASFAYFNTNRIYRMMYLAMCCLTIFFVIKFVEIDAFFTGTRFEKIISGRFDGSLLTRIQEVSDVYLAWTKSELYQKIFGAGLGGLFPLESIQNDKMLVFTDSGYLRHHVHSTPFALLLRFGLIGFLGYFYFIVYLANELIISGKYHARSIEGYISLILLLYLVSGLLFYIPTDPVFWIVVAGKFNAISLRSKSVEYGLSYSKG